MAHRDPNNGHLGWGRIRFGSTSDDTSRIEHAVIRYAGNTCLDWNCNTNHAAIEIVDSSPTIRNTHITRNRLHGISVKTTISDLPSQPTFTCLDIENNNDHGLFNESPTSMVQATNLWWGSTTGPLHETNPGGQGNKVSNGVTFKPWKQSRCVSVGALDYYIFLPLVRR